MDIDEISKKLNNSSEILQNDNSFYEISKNIKDSEFVDDYLKKKAKDDYYSQFSESEKIYQIKNDEYKKLISGFSPKAGTPRPFVPLSSFLLYTVNESKPIPVPLPKSLFIPSKVSL